MLTFDHIGIVVRDLAEGARLIERTLPVVEHTPRFDDPVLGVSVQFYRDQSDVVFELIAPFGDASPVANTLTQAHRINQLAYRCADVDESTGVLRKAKAVPLGAPAPALAFKGARVQFLWSPLGHVIELIETATRRTDFVALPAAANR